MIDGLEDWAVFTSDFGEVVTYTAPPEPPLEIRAIFTAAQTEAAPGALSGIMSVTPVLTIGAVQLPFEPQPGHSVTVRGVGYRVAETQPDGTGLIRLILERT